MIVACLAVLAGLVVLVWSADRCVDGASVTARNLGVSPLIVGLTIVALGTSAPEILVSAVASFDGQAGIGVGNAIGSNIANIALVLGITALITPLIVKSDTLRREYPVLLAVMLVSLVLIADGELGFVDGILLLAGMGLVIAWVVRIGIRSRNDDPMVGEAEDSISEGMSTRTAVFWMLLGLVLLLASSKLLVWGAVEIATELGVSDLIIGLTIIAIGTSLPELSATIASALRNEHDIAVGNIVGSNMFNLLGVMAMPGLIMPGAISGDVLARDFPIMVALTLALYIMAVGVEGDGKINRIEGGILLSAYVGYMVWLYYSVVTTTGV